MPDSEPTGPTMTHENSEPIRVLLADDHALLLAGLRALLELEPGLTVVGEAGDGFEAQRLSRQLAPDVLLLDVNMPGPGAVETVTYVREQCPRIKVIVLTAYDQERIIRPLVAAGVAGYLLKTEPREVMLRAIYSVARGATWFSPAILRQLAEAAAVGREALTAQEAALLRRIGSGQSDRQISQALQFSERTVRNHVRKICEKLGVSSRIEAVAEAARQGWI